MKNLFDSKKASKLFAMFGRKKKKNGMMWASIIGVGISIATFFFRRNDTKSEPQQVTKSHSPIENMIESFKNQSTGNILKTISATEFSNELSPKNNPLDNE